MKKTKLYLGLTALGMTTTGLGVLALSSCGCGPQQKYVIDCAEAYKHQYVDMYNDFTTVQKTVTFTGFTVKNMDEETIGKLKVTPVNKGGIFAGAITAAVTNVVEDTFDVNVTFRANVYITTASPTFDLQFERSDIAWSQTITGFSCVFAYSNVSIISSSEKTTQKIYIPATATMPASTLLKTDFTVYHNGNVADEEFMSGLQVQLVANNGNQQTSNIKPELVLGAGGTFYIKLNFVNFVEEVKTFKFTLQHVKNDVVDWQSSEFEYTLTISSKEADAYDLSEDGNNYIIDACNSSDEIVEIPDQYNGKDIVKIAPTAFNYCVALKEFKLNKNITKIDFQSAKTGWFKGCYNLEKITVDTANQTYTSQNKDGLECNCIMEKNIGSDDLWLIAGCKNTSFYRASAVTDIWPYAFVGCLGLTEVELPAKTTIVHDHAFDGCVALTSFKGTNVKNLYDSAFANCTSLVSIECGEALEGIYTKVFENCLSFTELYIPSKINFIYHDAFNGCVNLEKITVNEANTTFTSQSNGEEMNAIFKKGDKGLTLVRGCKSTKLTDEVIAIDQDAFNGSEGLTKLTIPNTVKSIAANAFEYCVDLQEIEIPQSVTTIGESCFANCYTLSKAVIKADCETLPELMFNNCYILEDVQLLGYIKTIGNQVFNNNYYLEEITIPESVMKIQYNAFSTCLFLTTANFVHPADWYQSHSSSATPIEESTLANPEIAAMYIVYDLYDARREMYRSK